MLSGASRGEDGGGGCDVESGGDEADAPLLARLAASVILPLSAAGTTNCLRSPAPRARSNRAPAAALTMHSTTAEQNLKIDVHLCGRDVASRPHATSRRREGTRRSDAVTLLVLVVAAACPSPSWRKCLAPLTSRACDASAAESNLLSTMSNSMSW